MSNHGTSEITRARELLNRFEHILEHKPRISCFNEAIELLKPYIEDDSDDGRLARNVQKAYIRRLLNELPTIGAGKLEIDDWFSYDLILTKLSTTVQAVCGEDLTLESNLNNFEKLYARDALEILRRHGYVRDEESK